MVIPNINAVKFLNVFDLILHPVRHNVLDRLDGIVLHWIRHATLYLLPCSVWHLNCIIFAKLVMQVFILSLTSIKSFETIWQLTDTLGIEVTTLDYRDIYN